MDSASTSADADVDADADADTDTDADADTGATASTTTDTSDTGAEVECVLPPARQLYMSPDDSNSMSSPALARAQVLEDGSPSTPIRTHEFVNYYSYGYAPAPADQVSLVVEMAQHPDLPVGEYIVQVGIVSEARDLDTRDPLSLTLVLDTSGSMTGDPIERLRDSCRAIAASLRAEDLVSMVTWSSDQEAVLAGHAVSGPSDPAVLSACDDMDADGGTDLSAGLEAGYALAETHHLAGAINRVVLISDGGANLGVTDEEVIGRAVGLQDLEGIMLAGVGVGDDSTYNDELMDAVTDLGRGAAVFIPTTAEADRMFQARFLEVMDVAARDVQMRLDVPDGFQLVRSSAEAVSEVRSEIPPQHLAPNDAMVFYNHIRTDCPTVPDDTPLTVWITYKDELTGVASELEQTFTFGELLGQSSTHLWRGAAVVAYAAALQNRDAASIQKALGLVAEAELLYPADPELAEIRSVLEALSP